MRILYTAGRELSYTRNDVVLRALRRFATVDVVGYDRPASVSVRTAQLLVRLAPRLMSCPYDLVYVGFYGHLLVPAIRAIARQAILFDAFVSTYDTLCFDRQIAAPGSLIGQLAFHLDQIACRLAKQVLLDTEHHVEFFAQTFDLFYPRASGRGECPEILFYATYQPLHGMETVIRAAAHLKAESQLRFRLIGTGKNTVRIRQLADQLQLDNIRFVPAVPLQRLPDEIASALICLGGHFGHSAKVGRVIPGKIYQMLAMGRPIIAADAPANRELLTHQETAYLCPPGEPEALADAILALYQSPVLQKRLAANARALYLERCSETVITKKLQHLTLGMVASQQ